MLALHAIERPACADQWNILRLKYGLHLALMSTSIMSTSVAFRMPSLNETVSFSPFGGTDTTFVCRAAHPLQVCIQSGFGGAKSVCIASSCQHLQILQTFCWTCSPGCEETVWPKQDHPTWILQAPFCHQLKRLGSGEADWVCWGLFWWWPSEPLWHCPGDCQPLLKLAEQPLDLIEVAQ